jgi:hypothetical protein
MGRSLPTIWHTSTGASAAWITAGFLGYDNSHGYHHRHFMGKTEPVEYFSYDALVERFYREVHELWRAEDAED